MSRRGQRPSRPTAQLAAAVLAALALLACWGGVAPVGAAARTLRFDGQRVEAPRSWPVYRLARHPRMCVRLDRRAVYLGTPGADQRCPATAAVGRRRAILVTPSAHRTPRYRGRHFNRIPGEMTTAGASAAASAGGAVFTGLGFDACSAPSSRSMAAWRASSPYEAIGVYIGGANRGCSQPNLTASWVGTQTAAGWHLIPTYVGLQAPTSSCGSCAKLSAAKATSQGEAAALDAVEEAAAVAIGPGSPIYFDMESYSRTSSATAATLAFLEAWTEKLHSLGYVSGVYSSGASGIADLAGQLGSGYALPDDIWVADWNGRQSSDSAYLPANAWTGHQRIHQYRGGHDESYGGVTINIDNDYVDGATVGTAAAGGDDPIGYLDLTGSPSPGQVRVKGWALDPSAPTQPLAIRAYVGGRAGAPGAVEYELGPVASVPRPDVGARHTAAGPGHGFDLSFPTLKSGSQPVCVYAVNAGPGADTLLGCRRTAIPVAIVLSNLKSSARGVHLRIACEWPAGTQCPGQLVLRTRVKVVVHRGRRRAAKVRVVTRSLGRRPFRLTGGRAHGFRVGLSAGGRGLLAQRGRLKAQLIAAIPGGHRVAVLRLGPSSR